ncbi:MAG TPA: ABC transporter substrate-binding protein [Candidatus Binatia bacterium]|nr:ABC transporter substrate-binding protein [Candidatus Binatia bacterium]
MRYKIWFSGFLFCVELLAFAALSCAATGSEKVRIGYPAFTGAYAPLWIAVAEGLGRKYGLDLEAIYAGRTSPRLLLESGAAQYTVATGFGTVQSYALGMKDHVIIASFANTTGFSIYSKPQITKAADLRGKVIGTAIPGDVTNSLARYVLKNRLSLDTTRDVKIVPLGEPPNVLPALEKGVVDAAMLGTPARLLARKMGFRELLDLDELGVLIPYVGINTLKATVKKSPDTTGKLVAALTDAIRVFKTNKEKSLLVMKKYLRGASEEILGDTYGYFSSRTQKLPYPSIEAIKTALDMLSDEYPQARSMDPHEVADLSFVTQVESAGSR